MNRLDKLSTRALIRLWIEAENRKQLSYFNSLNTNGCFGSAKFRQMRAFLRMMMLENLSNDIN